VRRAAAALLVLLAAPLPGCIVAVDDGGRTGLEKRLGRLERRAERLERERGLPPVEPPRKR
jgi:hypothetical protein